MVRSPTPVPEFKGPAFVLLALILTAAGMPAFAAEPGDKNGYELFHDGKRVGHEASWGLAQAIDNFRWNVEHHTGKRVTATLNGRQLPYLQAVRVLPIYYVPAGQAPPSESQKATLSRHLKIAQTRYAELLPQRISFSLADGPARVIQGRGDLGWVRKDYSSEAKVMTCQILQALQVDRLTCPWVLLVLVMNPKDGFPAGGGRPLNGGLNRGGGVVFVSSHALDHSPNFQSTLQHELGHGFGLTHVDTYGRDMAKNPSIMSYNLAHHTRGFEPAADPGVLIPEDLRALASNQLVFPGLRFVPARDKPAGHAMHPKIIVLNPMPLDCPLLPKEARALPTTCEERNPQVIREGSQTLWHGQHWECYPNGNWKLAETYKDGRLHGTQSWWDEDGNLRSEVAYLRGKKHGLERQWHASGILERVAAYRDDKLHGRLRMWTASGKLKQDSVYRAGIQHGQNILWDWEGAKVIQQVYEDGKLQGLETDWYPNGNKRAEGVHRAGKRHGKWTLWTEDGSPKAELHYRRGEPCGEIKRWTNRGQLTKSETPACPDL